jgi:uncharacterized protein (TIGR00251 family)
MRIIVDVKAGSREEKVEEIGEGLYIVWVKAPRRKGKANAAVLKLLKDHFGRRPFIVSGHTSTRKVIELEEEDYFATDAQF